VCNVGIETLVKIYIYIWMVLGFTVDKLIDRSKWTLFLIIIFYIYTWISLGF
jgi:hypothetical protein